MGNAAKKKVESEGTKSASSTTSDKTVVINFKRPTINMISVPIVGTGSMLMHRFTDGTVKGFIDKANGIQEVDKQKNIPIQTQFERSRYIIGETKTKGKPVLGFPASGFKGAIVAAARQHGDKKVSMSIVKQAITIDIDPEVHEMFLPFDDYETCEPRVDRICTNNSGKKNSNISVRAEVRGWKATLNIIFDPNSLTHEQVLQLVSIAGMSVGIGAWRPTSNGNFGRFKIDESRKITMIGK